MWIARPIYELLPYVYMLVGAVLLGVAWFLNLETLPGVLLVVGSKTSSNSNRLRELADRAGVRGYLIDGPDDLRQEWFADKRAVGLSAGASAPELLVRQVIERLQSWGGESAREVIGRVEHVVFGLPRGWRHGAQGARGTVA